MWANATATCFETDIINIMCEVVQHRISWAYIWTNIREIAMRVFVDAKTPANLQTCYIYSNEIESLTVS